MKYASYKEDADLMLEIISEAQNLFRSFGICNVRPKHRSTRMKNFIGIDCSSKAIHSVWLGNGGSILKQVKWEHKAKDFDERFFNFMSDFDHYLSTISKEAQAAVEAAIFIQNPKSTIALASVIGCVRYLCYKYGIDCVPIDNTKWKKIL